MRFDWCFIKVWFATTHTMCICSVIINCHPDFPLIVFHNRDEFKDRETQEAFINKQTNILGGVDTKMGGTWCGVNVKNGDFCMLTNCWSNKLNPVKNPVTRGFLVSHYLTKEEDGFEYLRKDYDSYQGFNLIYGNIFKPDSFIYESNRTESIPQKKQVPIEKSLKEGIHVCTNSFLNDKTWPKTDFLTQTLQNYFEEIKDKKISVEELKDKIIQIMCSRPSPSLEKFPKYTDVQPNEYDESDIEGIGNVFVNTKHTKTRSQIILIVDKNQNVNYFYGNTENFKVDGNSVEIDKSVYNEFQFKKD